jgi:hypothetical protein
MLNRLKYSRKPPLLLMGFSFVFGGLPLFSVMIAGTLASWGGCTLHEGFVNPCIILGQDIGQTLYAMGVSGWFMLVTIPFGLIGLLLGLVWLIIVQVLRVTNKT